ncbi:tRNA pseudouridine(38-40) synthase TruA [Rhodovulum sp. DZ06]|uniref:tRNA pseudouridine(38-40) synthase TruA n=1 Tax=Rhodovulum sp. DZ06 TaxID=3425126 RepID=UPI003D34C916
MPRYRLSIEYDGRPFRGWQRQADLPSVQQAVEEALARLDPAAPMVYGSGRTDAGVHATGQVAHADLSRDWDPFRLSEALNAQLRPHPVAILGAERAADDFHARFDAIERRYIYILRNRRAPLTLSAGQEWLVKAELDVEAMNEAARLLIGKHDFTTFRSTMCQAKSPVKTLDRLEVRREGDAVIFDVRARSFLHNQVRSFVGTLERVGSGAWAPERVGAALAAADRAACGPVAPPDGLRLDKVIYPE